MQASPDLLPAPSHIIGPTWQKLKDGTFWLPEPNRTLGDRVVNWMSAYLKQPGGPDVGGKFTPTFEQYRFLLWWYAIDENGKFTYRNGLLRRVKGWGKDPLVAAIALAELCGPVQFSHFDENGLPVGCHKEQAWIQVAAISQDQTSNTFRMFPAMISKKLKEEFSLDVNKTIIYAPHNAGQIEGVTSSPYALEGKRPTFVILNEVQWWVETNQGHEMYEVITGNVTKSSYGNCRYLAICNAHRPGEDSVGERIYRAWQDVAAGLAPDTGALYDSIEAPADTPVSEIPPEDEDPEGYEEGIRKLREGLLVARGDAVWLNIDNIIASLLTRNNDIIEGRRKFLNQVNAAEDAWIAPNEWRRCENTSLELKPKDRITLGFDGSKSGDWTALVACRVEDAALFVIKVWNPDNYGGEVPREQVDATVRSAFERYDVVAFRADVREFEAYVDQWSQDFRKRLKVNASPNNSVAFDMRGQKKRFAFDCERFLDAVLEKELQHNGNKVLESHVSNAHTEPTNYDAVTIKKVSKDSSKKIDAAVCAVLAYGARYDFLVSKKNQSRKATVLRA